MPPFLAGQLAFHAGAELSANPHPSGNIDGRGYPGPFLNWRDGWIHAQAVKFHDEKRSK